MVVWGFNVSAIKLLVSHFPPVFIQGLRVFTAGLVVMGFLLFTKNMKKMSRKTLIGILIAGVFGVLGHHICLAIGLTTTTAANAGLILGLIPLVTTILAMIFLDERLTIIKMIGIILAFLGVCFIVLQSGSVNGFAFGDLFILGAVITQAISFVLIKKLSVSIDSRQMTGIMLVFGSFLLLGISFILEGNDVLRQVGTEQPGYIWLVFLASAVIATSLGHLLYNYAIHRLGAGSTAIFINLTPFFSLVGSAWFLGEAIYFAHIIGFILIILGVIFGTGTIERYYLYRKTKKYKNAV